MNTRRDLTNWRPWQNFRNQAGFGWKWDQWFWWNGWGWNKRALIGFVPFRNRSWQPDIAPSTVRHFQFHIARWAAHRNTTADQVYIDMNTGSTVSFQD